MECTLYGYKKKVIKVKIYKIRISTELLNKTSGELQ